MSVQKTTEICLLRDTQIMIKHPNQKKIILSSLN